jgi:hypothetical protein
MLVVWQTQQDMLCCAEISQQTDEMGQFLPIINVGDMSVVPPIATKSLHARSVEEGQHRHFAAQRKNGQPFQRL